MLDWLDDTDSATPDLFADWLSDDSVPLLDEEDTENLSTDELAQKRRQDRIKRCGYFILKIDEHGKRVPSRCYCGVWQLCPNCFTARVAKLERRLKHIFSTYDLQKVTLPPDQLQNFCRRHGAANYISLPNDATGEPQCTIYIHTDKKVGTPIEEPDLPLEVLARTSVGYHWSGKLGLLPPTPKEGTKVTIHALACNVTEEIATESWLETYIKTKALHPETADQFKAAFLTRQDEFKEQLIQRGVSDFSYIPQTYYIREKELDWTFDVNYELLLRHKIDQFKARTRPKAA